MKPITDFVLIDHGYDYPDHFQGCGVAYTRFDDCVTGAGLNPSDALDNALDQLADEGYDVSEVEAELVAEVEALVSLEDEEQEAGLDDELQYYLSIRFVRP